MSNKVLLCILILLNFACSNNKIEDSEIFNLPIAEENHGPAEVATLEFVNEYVKYSNDSKYDHDILEWCKYNSNISTDFFSSLKSILNNPNLDESIDFDPIFDAQDYPEEGFEIKDSLHGNYLTIRGKDWNEFELKVKVLKGADKWLIDGIGAINMDNDYREIINSESISIASYNNHPFLRDKCRQLLTINTVGDTIDSMEIYCDPGSGCDSHIFETDDSYVLIDCNGEWYEIKKEWGTIKDIGWYWEEDPPSEIIIKFSSGGKRIMGTQVERDKIYQYKDFN